MIFFHVRAATFFQLNERWSDYFKVVFDAAY